MASLPLAGSNFDVSHIRRAAEIADFSATLTAPHPNFGCVIAKGPKVFGEGFLYAQGTKCAELKAVEAAGEFSRGATAYLNLEPGDCVGDDAAVSALVQAGISRVVVGLRHPLEHLRGKTIRSLRSQGVLVDVLGEELQSEDLEEARKSCKMVNAPLLYRAAYHVPFSIFKYAMTLDGKIACSSGHASWISCQDSRGQVLKLRGISDAVIVGGNTLRRDDPRLTVRDEIKHCPMRIVMSQTMNIPEVAKLWDVDVAPTIVATQRGARKDLQKLLASKGVEVVEFDFLKPRDVMAYFYDRGYLSILWECGGSLAAAAISDGIIHKVVAFVAPKIIGGLGAPSPVGELGMVEMSQARNLIDVSFKQVGRDMLVTGYLQPIPDVVPVIPSMTETSDVVPGMTPYEADLIFFYKTWDPYGAFSNFSPHSLHMFDERGEFIWPSVEHYYQANKFFGVEDTLALSFIEQIKSARSPEEAARKGRKMQKQRKDLVRADWDELKIDVMYEALKCKFSTYPILKDLLLSTGDSILVEASPHDLFWGGGRDGEGLNYLGRLLMKLRLEFRSPKEV